MLMMLWPLTAQIRASGALSGKHVQQTFDWTARSVYRAILSLAVFMNRKVYTGTL